MILKNCGFVPFLTEGTDLTKGDVLVTGNRIAKIAPCGTDFGTEEEILDLEGKTLLPGLIDIHCHLYYDEYSAIYDARPDTEHTINAAAYAAEFLKDGYTTVRDCGDKGCRCALHVRRAVEDGRLPGPRITTSGPNITSPWTDHGVKEFHVSGADAFRDATRRNFAYGSDFIKIYGSGSLLSPSNEPGYPIVEPDEYEQIILVAKRHASYAAVHAHGTLAIDMAVKAGVHTVEHASMISEETLRYIEETKQDTALVLTMYAMDEILQQPDTYNGKRMHRLMDKIIGCLKNAYENHKSILIGWGTDVGMKTYVKDPMHEFRLRKEMLGFSNEDILRQATINSAKIIYQDHEIGSIKEGKLADLVVVDGDPVRDISVMYKSPRHVIKDGVLIR